MAKIVITIILVNIEIMIIKHDYLLTLETSIFIEFFYLKKIIN